MDLKSIKYASLSDLVNVDVRLIVLDVDGVLRDYSELMNESLAVGFKKCGLHYKFDCNNVWHIRGMEKYNSRNSVIKVLICLSRAEIDLESAIGEYNVQQIIDRICNDYIEFIYSDIF